MDQRRPRRQSALRVDDRRQLLVVDLHQPRRAPRGGRIDGNDRRHRLALVPHFLGGQHRLVPGVGPEPLPPELAQVVDHQHGDDTGEACRRTRLDAHDPRMGEGAPHQRGVHDAGDDEILEVLSAPGDLGQPILALDRAPNRP